MDTDSVITIISFFVSIASIIGAFFYVEMGGWLQKILKFDSTRKKMEKNSTHRNDKEIYELELRLGEYDNNVFKYLILIINGFLLVLLFLSIISMRYVPVSDIYDVFLFFYVPFWLFNVLFIITSAIIVYTGYGKLDKISTSIKEWAKK
ncbi:MAG: hypothetical protein ACW99Q_22015 [Candidatus Kariarchaeaceae archaeon]|jgi:hypothetical protein